MKPGGEEKPALPGPKKKQAEALRRNVEWMAATFGPDRVGFLTLTVGDWVNGRFVHVTDRAEASRRFNSLLTHVIRRRYRCGVIVMERHKNGGIHYHLICVAPGRIRRGFRWDDFDNLQAAVKAGKIKGWGADAVGAGKALKAEWRLWRQVAPRFQFGRCEMLPMRKNGEALGCYAAKYISKSWETRKPEDKGARLVRYFGKWALRSFEKKILRVRASRGEVKPPKLSPNFTSSFGRMTPLARLWRESVRQVAIRCNLDGVSLTQENVKHFSGRRWAWHYMRKFSETEFLPSRRVSDIENERAEVSMQVAEACADLNFGFGIADQSRGAGFWKFEVREASGEPDREMMRWRVENKRMIEMQEGMDEMQAWCNSPVRPYVVRWYFGEEKRCAGVDYLAVIDRLVTRRVKVKKKRVELPKMQRLLFLMNRRA